MQRIKGSRITTLSDGSCFKRVDRAYGCIVQFTAVPHLTRPVVYDWNLMAAAGMVACSAFAPPVNEMYARSSRQII